MNIFAFVLLYCLLIFLFLTSFYQQAIIQFFSSSEWLSNPQTLIKGFEFLKFIIFAIFFYLIARWKKLEFVKPVKIFLTISVIALFSIHCVYFSPFTVDDAFISFQYAKNLANSNGLTFNAPERIEGYTNFLLVLIEALFLTLGIDIIVGVKIIGTLAGAGIILIMYRFICAELQDDSAIHLLPCLVIALNSPFVLASTTGLETQLFSLAIFSGVFVYLRNKTTTGTILASLILTLSVLIRPEGLIIFALLTIFKLQSDDEFKPGIDFVFWISTFLVIFVPYFLWRYSYFGELLPNTFHAKVGGDLAIRMVEGKKYVRAFIKTFGLSLLLLLPIIEFLRGKLSKSGKTILMIILTYFIYIGYTGKDWIPQFRFVAPVIPFIFSLIYTSSINLYKAIKTDFTWDRRGIFKLCLPLILAYFVSGTISFKNTAKIYEHTMMRAAGYEHAHKRLARWFKDNTPENAVIAIMDVGIVKYYSERYILDITGLTDKFIARSEGGLLDKDYDLSYIFDKKPDYIVLVTLKDLSVHPFESLRTIDTNIYLHPDFKDNYLYLFNLDHFYKSPDKEKGYYLNVFERRS